MIISESKRFVFIHNPKCAGTSVRMALMRFDTTGNFFWNQDRLNSLPFDKAHIPLYQWRSMYPNYFQLLEEFLTFIFVRHPYDRAVSGFNEVHNKIVPTGEPGEDDAEYRKTLNEFISKLDRARMRKEMIRYRHFLRQTDMVYLGHKCMVDVIMKLEEFPECLDQLAVFLPDIAKVIGHGKKRNVKPLNNPHSSYLTRESIEVINEFYKDDFDLFGYTRL